MLCLFLVALCLVGAGCSSQKIQSDLVLDLADRAVIELHNPTEAIVLVNRSDAPVRVRVLDRKRRVMSDLPLGARDRVRLDLEHARSIEIENQSPTRAVLRWTLTNDDSIEYSLAMNPGGD
jgi:hypothetical protein